MAISAAAALRSRPGSVAAEGARQAALPISGDWISVLAQSDPNTRPAAPLFPAWGLRGPVFPDFAPGSPPDTPFAPPGPDEAMTVPDVVSGGGVSGSLRPGPDTDLPLGSDRDEPDAGHAAAGHDQGGGVLTNCPNPGGQMLAIEKQPLFVADSKSGTDRHRRDLARADPEQDVQHVVSGVSASGLAATKPKADSASYHLPHGSAPADNRVFQHPIDANTALVCPNSADDGIAGPDPRGSKAIGIPAEVTHDRLSAQGSAAGAIPSGRGAVWSGSSGLAPDGGAECRSPAPPGGTDGVKLDAEAPRQSARIVGAPASGAIRMGNVTKTPGFAFDPAPGSVAGQEANGRVDFDAQTATGADAGAVAAESAARKMWQRAPVSRAGELASGGAAAVRGGGASIGLPWPRASAPAPEAGSRPGAVPESKSPPRLLDAATRHSDPAVWLPDSVRVTLRDSARLVGPKGQVGHCAAIEFGVGPREVDLGQQSTLIGLTLPDTAARKPVSGRLSSEMPQSERDVLVPAEADGDLAVLKSDGLAPGGRSSGTGGVEICAPTRPGSAAAGLVPQAVRSEKIVLPRLGGGIDRPDLAAIPAGATEAEMPGAESAAPAATLGDIPLAAMNCGDPGAPIALAAPDPLRHDPGRMIGQHLARALALQAHGPADALIEMVLAPDELGSVRLVMVPQAEGILLRIQVDSGDTLALMRRHADSLAAEFRALGFGSVSFEFGQSRQQPPLPPGTALPRGGGHDVPQVPDAVLAPATAETRAGLDLRL